ncbi:MAG: hypothetical protein M3281_09995 [Chloroflexota bacterium]|nr:hypothetical protein [Chloroflexota bacterium]
MPRKFVTLALLALLVSALVVTPAGAGVNRSPATAGGVTATSNVAPAPISGTVKNTSGQVGKFAGNVSNLAITLIGKSMYMTGVLNGVSTIGTTTTRVTNAYFSSRVNPVYGTSSSVTAAACSILALRLGPINLNLLGLVITTNQINLNIIAVPGPGNLLGNLLCALVGLLDNVGGNTGGNSIANLLRTINSLLR